MYARPSDRPATDRLCQVRSGRLECLDPRNMPPGSWFTGPRYESRPPGSWFTGPRYESRLKLKTFSCMK